MSAEIIKDYHHSQKMKASKGAHKKKYLIIGKKIERFDSTRIQQITNKNILLKLPQSHFTKH